MMEERRVRMAHSDSGLSVVAADTADACVSAALALRACIRAGFQSWPGLYPVTFITADSDVVCPHCVIQDFKRCISDIRNNMHDRIVGLVCAADMDPSPGYECRDCGETMWEPEEFPTHGPARNAFTGKFQKK